MKIYMNMYLEYINMFLEYMNINICSHMYMRILTVRERDVHKFNCNSDYSIEFVLILYHKFICDTFLHNSLDS